MSFDIKQSSVTLDFKRQKIVCQLTPQFFIKDHMRTDTQTHVPTCARQNLKSGLEMWYKDFGEG